MFPLLSSDDRFRMQLRCVNRTKSARRSASAFTEAPEAFIVFIMAGCSVHVSGHARGTAMIEESLSEIPGGSSKLGLNNYGCACYFKRDVLKIGRRDRFWKQRIPRKLIIFLKTHGSALPWV